MELVERGESGEDLIGEKREEETEDKKREGEEQKEEKGKGEGGCRCFFFLFSDLVYYCFLFCLFLSFPFRIPIFTHDDIYIYVSDRRRISWYHLCGDLNTKTQHINCT